MSREPRHDPGCSRREGSQYLCDCERGRREAAAPRVLVPPIASVHVIEKGVVRTPLGPALRVTIHRHDKRQMAFWQVWEAFSNAYPGKYAVQLFPPRAHYIDMANKYHLHVFANQPEGLDLFDRQEPRGGK